MRSYDEERGETDEFFAVSAEQVDEEFLNAFNGVELFDVPSECHSVVNLVDVGHDVLFQGLDHTADFVEVHGFLKTKISDEHFCRAFRLRETYENSNDHVDEFLIIVEQQVSDLVTNLFWS